MLLPGSVAERQRQRQSHRQTHSVFFCVVRVAIHLPLYITTTTTTTTTTHVPKFLPASVSSSSSSSLPHLPPSPPPPRLPTLSGGCLLTTAQNNKSNKGHTIFNWCPCLCTGDLSLSLTSLLTTRRDLGYQCVLLSHEDEEVEYGSCIINMVIC